MTESAVTIEETASLHEAYEKMQSFAMHHLPVTSDGKLVGLLSDGDLKITQLHPNPKTLSVGDVMSPDPFTAAFDLDIKTVLSEMIQNRYSCALVLDGKCNLAGIFTIHDAIRLLAHLLGDE